MCELRVEYSWSLGGTSRGADSWELGQDWSGSAGDCVMISDKRAKKQVILEKCVSRP